MPEIKLVGITCRTANGLELDPATAKIGSTMQKYFYGKLAASIEKRKKPGVTYCVYTGYEGDFTGNYTYFIGEEVDSFDGVKDGFSSLVIPKQNYVKFTSGPGALPNICISSWQEIWAMSAKDFGGARAYVADFEVYDERAHDQQNAIFDIYIGIDE